MKLFWLVSLLSLLSCSQTPDKKESQLEVVRVSTEAIDECLDYQKNIIDLSYTINKDNSVQFTRDFNLARAVIAQFDMDKTLTKPRATMVQNILKVCDEEKVKTFNSEIKRLSRCTPMISELNFFQGLSFAIKKYPWPADLQLEGKKVALDYVRYYSEGHFPLIHRLVALSVLDELSVNQIVNKDLHPEIKTLMQDSQRYVEGLRMRLTKDATLSCESLQIVRDELSYSDVVGEKLRSLLTRI